MEGLSSELAGKVKQLEARLLDPTLKEEFTMLVQELALSVKTLETELQAERSKSEAMRHNLRTLANAPAAPHPRTAEPLPTPPGQPSPSIQAGNPRYLDGAKELSLRYKSYRELGRQQSDSSVSAPQLPFADQRARSNTQLNTEWTISRPRPSPSRSMSTVGGNAHHVSIATKPLVQHVSSHSRPTRPAPSTLDAFDNFSLDDLVIDSPFLSAAEISSGLIDPTPSIYMAREESPPKPAQASQISMPPKSASAPPSSPPSSPPSEHHLPAHDVPAEKQDMAHIEPSKEPETEIPLSSPVEASSPLAPLSSPEISPRKVTISSSQDSLPTWEDLGVLNAETVLETLHRGLKEGTRQRIEIEQGKKQQLVQNMQASTPVAQPADTSAPSRASAPRPEKAPLIKARSKSMKKVKVVRSAGLSHPTGLKVGSYRLEQDEFERIFYLTRSFIEPPNAEQRAEEAKFTEEFKRRLGILRESLDYDVDFSSCDLLSLPAFVMEMICKTTRFTAANNRLNELPNQIRKFDKLEELALENNQIVRVPGAIGHLKNLRILNLSNNKLTEMPTDIAYLEQLEQLNLSENQLTDLTKFIGWLIALRTLNVSKNPLTTLPAELALCTDLSVIQANTCFLKKLPKELANLVELEYLDLSHNSLKELPPQMGLLTKLRVLNVQHNQLTDMPLSLGLCNALVTGNGNLEISQNPWNAKLFATVLSGETTMSEVLIQRVVANQKQLSKLQPHPLPKLPTLNAPKPTIENERWTLQEKIVCLGDWVTHTIETYIRPVLSRLFSDLVATTTTLDSPELKTLVSLAQRIKTLVWRSEPLLKPPPFATSRSFEEQDVLAQVKAILTGELMELDSLLRSLVPTMRTAAISERLEDTVTVVHVVHFVRDLLFILVLDEQRSGTTNGASTGQTSAEESHEAAPSSPTTSSP